MHASNDDAESVDAFLERIASLKDKRDREKEEPTRKLEEDILQGRRERQARRAERTRSLSPPKNSQPATSPSSLTPSYHGSTPDHATQPPVILSPSPQTHTLERSGQSEAMKYSTPDGTQNHLPPSPIKCSVSSSAESTAISRSGTLSWQQRPSSRDSATPRNRPRSRDNDETAPATRDLLDEERTRDQIAQSLNSKDPSWFRQTADRGAHSDAYRKNREETQLEDGCSSRQLPGMSRASSVDPTKAPLPSSSRDKSRSPSQASSAADTNSWGNRFSSISSHSTQETSRSPLPTKPSQRFVLSAEPLGTDHPEVKRTGLPSLQDQVSRERPTSPTKGLGGFVQSAMMKRSDSVNKRWSAQAAPGLSRGNSTTSYRGGMGYSSSLIEVSRSPPREPAASSPRPTSSPAPKSRPSSSHSTSTALTHGTLTAQPSYAPNLSMEAAPASSNSSTDKDVATVEISSKEQQIIPKSPVLQSSEALPVSPTKTMDPKRWSPTKASWLESALARPESPKLTSPKPQTPSWMAELQRSKLSKEDSDPVKSPPSGFTMASPEKARKIAMEENRSAQSNDGLQDRFEFVMTRKVSSERARDPMIEEAKSTQPTSSAVVRISSTSSAKASAENTTPSEVGDASIGGKKEEIPTSVPTSPEKSPPSIKPKLQPPPRTDFRATLRPSRLISEESTSKEPEFKNMFGKLKRTETRTYVAPDALKDNILRGKAALNLTDGPQKGKRVDDFKESILKRKESMKTEASLPRKLINETDRNHPTLQNSSTLPEALAKRSTLKKRINSAQASPTGSGQQTTSVISHPLPSQPVREDVSSAEAQTHSVDAAFQPSKVASNLHGEGPVSKSQEQGSPSAVQPIPIGKSAVQMTSKPATVNSSFALEKHPRIASEATEQSVQSKTENKLASRLNPGLAGILSRGPISTASSRNESSEDVSSARNAGPPSTVEEPAGSTTRSLTHMTKERARGPKRRLPNTACASAKPQDPSSISDKSRMLGAMLDETKSKMPVKNAAFQDTTYSPYGRQAVNVSAQPLADLINRNDQVVQPVTAKKQLFSPQAGQHVQEAVTNLLPKAHVKDKPKPAIAEKSPTLRKISSAQTGTSRVTTTTLNQEPVPQRDRTSKQAFPSYDDGREMGGSNSAISRPTDLIQRESSASTSSNIISKSGAGAGLAMPNRPLHVQPNGTSAPPHKPALSGLGLKLDSSTVQLPHSQLTPPPDEQSTMALDAQKSSFSAQAKGTSGILEPVPSQQGYSKAAELLAEFFNEKPEIGDKVEIDAQTTILNRAGVGGKRKVLRTQVWQINADGRKESSPPQQEHILFEDCMYLCVHSFESLAGSVATEVYLWAGDGVGEAAMEDAQLFCRKEARENTAKLELLRQGKEPAKFYQALGGIVITRRSRTSALYMLCGRRHLGHMAFDEVDLDPASLCSGFPYLISAKFGKLYLWKGKGSGADEVGCARLIGMDLGLTGEIEEVEEGEEPTSFIESLGGTMHPQMSSQQWSLRSRSNHYGCRLFRIELEQSKGMSGFWSRRGSSPAKATKASAVEIHPFCHRDLDSRCIFVLDAYFNIFVYVGAEAGSKSAEFATAVMFAQEYGILASSLEDRPFIPSCNITFYGGPPEFTAAFRKWEQSTGSRSQQQQPCQVIPLNNILGALSGATFQA
ncbi:hypothetical protein EPUS_08429 [Endocarpon pusillum Z07020]|uniref:DUF4045 domain-containing protein n=1 Tax=Endocarpon pusillum (strain Z07020 / HMAS-L-300199) TaxID=1263415 RepID=U1I0W1_ENDPU|nr:uncharacterized protein EPUS_08429 [Endocarpon pusillum Z07020]ERF75524.1 hypothetical protein EPUS_08429 [Endocarpon pusillum Z07020]